MRSKDEAALEARLLILRNRARTAARSMQDRGTSRSTRDAAAITWAQARREAEKVERELQAARRPVRKSETKRTVVTDKPDFSKVTNKASTRSPQTPALPPPGASSTSVVRQAGTKTRPPPDVASDHRDKTAREISRISRRMRKNGHPSPLGDPTSGIVLVVEQPVGPRLLAALKLSLRAVSLPEAYVTYASTGLLKEELLATEPQALIAIGAGAARDIDVMAYPLDRQPFSEAEPGVWFSWTKGASGLLLPSLAPALDDEAAKRRFWRTFLSLKALAPKQ